MSIPDDEEVALYGDAGEAIGSAMRSVVRAKNLHHGATAVVVHDGRGRVYVHRRTQTKDVYPGLLDFCAGGVIRAGEGPGESAGRETQEELGVSGAPLVPVAEDSYTDAHTSYHAFLYVVEYRGTIRWQPEEVAWGEWVPLGKLLQRLEESPDDFVPDSRTLWRGRLAAQLI